MNDKGAKLTMPVTMLWVEMQAGRQEAERSRDGLTGRPAASPKVQGAEVQDAVVVFLSLAARYFHCMCSTPKVSRFDRLTSGSSKVGAGRRLEQLRGLERPPAR